MQTGVVLMSRWLRMMDLAACFSRIAPLCHIKPDAAESKRSQKIRKKEQVTLIHGLISDRRGKCERASGGDASGARTERA
jgi:hypothetical protein